MLNLMSLRELIEAIDDFDDELAVLRKADCELSSESEIYVVDVNAELNTPAGLREFMDVWHIRDVIHGKSKLAGLETPDVPTKIQLLLDYAKNDA